MRKSVDVITDTRRLVNTSSSTRWSLVWCAAERLGRRLRFRVLAWTTFVLPRRFVVVSLLIKIIIYLLFIVIDYYHYLLPYAVLRGVTPTDRPSVRRHDVEFGVWNVSKNVDAADHLTGPSSRERCCPSRTISPARRFACRRISRVFFAAVQEMESIRKWFYKPKVSLVSFSFNHTGWLYPRSTEPMSTDRCTSQLKLYYAAYRCQIVFTLNYYIQLTKYLALSCIVHHNPPHKLMNGLKWLYW